MQLKVALTVSKKDTLLQPTAKLCVEVGEGLQLQGWEGERSEVRGVGCIFIYICTQTNKSGDRVTPRKR